jgi:hypothetical protein
MPKGKCFQNVIAFGISIVYIIIDIVCVTMPFVKLEGIAFCIFLKEEIAYESKRENEKTA